VGLVLKLENNCLWLQKLYHELDAWDKLQQDFQRKWVRGSKRELFNVTNGS